MNDSYIDTLIAQGGISASSPGSPLAVPPPTATAIASGSTHSTTKARVSENTPVPFEHPPLAHWGAEAESGREPGGAAWSRNHKKKLLRRKWTPAQVRSLYKDELEPLLARGQRLGAKGLGQAAAMGKRAKDADITEDRSDAEDAAQKHALTLAHASMGGRPVSELSRSDRLKLLACLTLPPLGKKRSQTYNTGPRNKGAKHGKKASGSVSNPGRGKGGRMSLEYGPEEAVLHMLSDLITYLEGRIETVEQDCCALKPYTQKKSTWQSLGSKRGP